MRTTRWAWGLLAVAVLVTGCKRVEDEKTVTLEAHIARGVMEVPGQPKEMKVAVTATSPGAAVTIYLVPTASAEQMMNDLDAKKEPAVLAKSNTGESVKLEGTMPANTDCTVVAASDKKTQVTAKFVGRY